MHLAISVILLFFSFALHAQHILTGKVVDLETHLPLQHTQVMICGSTYSSMTNESGEFYMYLTEQETGDLLCFSALGYQTHKFPLSAIEDTSYLYIEMEPDPRDNIRRVNREKVNPQRIVKNAIKKIPDNYPSTAYEYDGYYRETIKKEGSYYEIYYAFLEAAMRIYDPHFDLKNGQVELLQIRDRMHEDISAPLEMFNQQYDIQLIPDFYLWNSGGNSFMSLIYNDPIRNREADLFAFVFNFKEEFIWTHRFSLEDIISWDGKAVYHIHCTYTGSRRYRRYTHLKAENNLIEGDIFIDAQSLAIIKFSYANYGKTDKILRYLIDVEYQPFQSRWYPKRIEFNNLLVVVDSAEHPFFLHAIKWRKWNDYVVLEFNEVLSESSPINASSIQVHLEGEELLVNSVKRYNDKELMIYIPTLGEKLRRYTRKNEDIEDSEVLSQLLRTKTLTFYISESLTDTYGNGFGLPPLTHLYHNRQFFVNHIERENPQPIPEDDQMDLYHPFHDWDGDLYSEFWDQFNHIPMSSTIEQVP